MKALILITYIFFCKINCRAQKLELTIKGLTLIEIDNTITKEMAAWLKPVKNYSYIKDIRLDLVEKYNYYYITENSLDISNVGFAKAIFFASDSTDRL